LLAPQIHRQRLVVELITDEILSNFEYAESLITRFLYDLCDSLGMKVLLDPIVKHVPDGTSAVMMWLESGVQVHTWWKYKFVSIDIYSCKQFMISDALEVIGKWFSPKAIEVYPI